MEDYSSQQYLQGRSLAASGDFALIAGEFAAYREIENRELASMVIDYLLPPSVKAKLLLESERTLAAHAQRLPKWMLEPRPMCKPDVSTQCGR